MIDSLSLSDATPMTPPLPNAPPLAKGGLPAGPAAVFPGLFVAGFPDWFKAGFEPRLPAVFAVAPDRPAVAFPKPVVEFPPKPIVVLFGELPATFGDVPAPRLAVLAFAFPVGAVLPNGWVLPNNG